MIDMLEYLSAVWPVFAKAAALPALVLAVCGIAHVLKKIGRQS